MGDFLRVIIDSLGYLWPFRFVHVWEGGGYYVLGKMLFAVKPGRLYVILPWFCDVKTLTVVSHRVTGGRQDITMLDGTMLSFEARAEVEVFDVDKALNDVDDMHHAVQLDMAAVLAEGLATEDPDRLRPRRRGTLFKELTAKVSAETEAYGVRVSDVGFISFVLKVRAHRLFIDQGLPPLA